MSKHGASVLSIVVVEAAYMKDVAPVSVLSQAAMSSLSLAQDHSSKSIVSERST